MLLNALLESVKSQNQPFLKINFILKIKRDSFYQKKRHQQKKNYEKETYFHSFPVEFVLKMVSKKIYRLRVTQYKILM